MRKIEKVEAFRTTDGQMYTVEGEAIQHQKELDFRMWCNGNFSTFGLLSGDGIAIDILKGWHITCIGEEDE